jgi:type II secretion system (T2SS) protein E
MKLGTLLLRNAAIGLSQLEAALRNQVLYGGRLGTNLVELGFLDLELLSGYLAELTGMPIATPTLLDAADPAVLGKLGVDAAHLLRAIPLGYLSPGEIAVAMVDPSDGAAADALATRLGDKIVRYVVPELRALYYLEKHFGLPRRARFVRTGAPPPPEPAPEVREERRRTQPAAGMVMPPAFTLEPRRRRVSTQIPLGVAPAAATLAYGAACQQIDTANNRDQIVSTFIDYAIGRCEALIVFIIRDGNALGWRGHLARRGVPKQPFEELSLPLRGASALQSAHDTGERFVGPPPSAARPVEAKLWAALGTVPEPTEVIVIPVMVKQRPVNLIYAHTAGTPPAWLIAELSDLATRAQTSYARLIRQTRG